MDSSCDPSNTLHHMQTSPCGNQITSEALGQTHDLYNVEFDKLFSFARQSVHSSHGSNIDLPDSPGTAEPFEENTYTGVDLQQVDSVEYDTDVVPPFGSSIFSPQKFNHPDRSSSIPLPSLPPIDFYRQWDRSESFKDGISDTDEDLFANFDASLHSIQQFIDDDDHTYSVHEACLNTFKRDEPTCTSYLAPSRPPIWSQGHEEFAKDQLKQLSQAASRSPSSHAARESLSNIPGSPAEGGGSVSAQDLIICSPSKDTQPLLDTNRTRSHQPQHAQSAPTADPAGHPDRPHAGSSNPRPLSRNTMWVKFVFGSSFPDDDASASGDTGANRPIGQVDTTPNGRITEQDLDTLSLAPIVSSSDEEPTQGTWQRDRMSIAVERDRHREKEWSSIWPTQRYRASDGNDDIAADVTSTSAMCEPHNSTVWAREQVAHPTSERTESRYFIRSPSTRQQESSPLDEPRSDFVEPSKTSSPVKIKREPGAYHANELEAARWWRGGKVRRFKDKGKQKDEAIEISSEEEEEEEEEDDEDGEEVD
ncbi:hypothetical protein BDZ85DRAFT_85528 [Elsinoe ampelina]|uniref:Uncharacterized protein n=1 Tax=Elsinoe ampelina TaxID=302913 RepID=A0A6A6GGT7_9PEZI|nr:hypothetical protein BDZ85DRAFT_85528 [Elsinoe ampelina]